MPRDSYQDRINRVTAYVYEHLDEELDLERLADIAAMSPWHWHRIYSAMRGETVASAVRRLRLMRAADELANGHDPVQAVARRSGYDNVQSFTRIFTEAFGLPPAKYRREGSHRVFDPIRDGAPRPHFDIRIVAVPAIDLVVEPHAGSFMSIGQSFGRLFGRVGAAGRLGGPLRMIGVYLDDPSAVVEDKLRSLAGLSLEPPLPEGEQRYSTRAGDYAVLRHVGPYADMRGAYAWMFGTWLPQSGREAADAPVLEEYLNSPENTPPTQLMTDLYLPLR